mgnify:CR=1 FL=1
MRTWKITISPKHKKDAVLCEYMADTTTDARCMYNTANFYIRNTMTGIKKSPELRTSNEIEVLHYVFTGIQKANEMPGDRRHVRCCKNIQTVCKTLQLSGSGSLVPVI